MNISKRYFGVIICLSLLFLPLAIDDAVAACSPSVQIAGHSSYAPLPTSITPIQDAYDYASNDLGLSNFTLKLAGEIFTEDLALDGGAVVLDGGYDCDFVTKTSPSSVFGKITIKSGSLNVAAGTESPKVVSTDQCAFDNDGDGYTSIGSCTGSADDCNDNDFAINPGASEICDGLDNNCDSQIDEGLTGTDADGDGYYAENSCAAVADDCNDNDATINPGALDIPYDGINQDCSTDGDLTFDNGDACADCHFLDDALDSVHSYRPSATDSTCVLCHAGPVSSILSGHYGKTVRTIDYPDVSTIDCWTCHDNNDHSGGGVFGDGLGDVWNDVAPPYPGNYTCDDCHANRAARHATATAHNNRVIDSTCANCHTSDTTVLGSPGTGTLASAADVDALHGVSLPTDCALCHAYSGTLLDKAVVLTAIRQGLSGTQVSCLDCHTDKGTNHGNFEHPIEVGPNDLSYNPGQLCSDCHVVANWTEIEGTEHNVATNGAGSCATCHNSPRQIVQNVIADAPNNGGYPIRCLACHADKELVAHGSIDHVAATYVTRGTSFCLDCHDPGTAANATVDITHNGTCSLCHTTIPDLQPGVPTGGGDCVTCHTVTWQTLHITNPPDHSSLVTTSGTNNCASCHADALVDASTHLSDCTNCHNASDGTLVTTLGTDQQTFAVGGNCETCHTDSWEVTHTSANTPDHGFLVRVAATSCDDCHSDPPPLTDAGDPKVHDGCGSCHNSDGSLVTLLGTDTQDLNIGGDCASCHTDTFDALHVNHVHTVAEGAGDLSFDPPGTLCSDCHVVATWIEIEGTEHNVATNGAGSCSTCHNSDRAEVITAISNSANPTNCLDCHSNKDLTVHGSIDHVASGDVTLAIACADCHDDSAQGANWTVDFTHTANCTLCHTTVPNMQPGVPAGPADCATCHSAAWNVTHLSNTPDHSSLVTTTGTNNCANCHADALIDASTHVPDCSNCHNGDGSLKITLGTDIQTFAIGGNCETCHTGRDWTDHDIAHATNSYVTSYVGCTSCHAAALTDGAGFVDPANNGKHDACTTCHAADGAISVTVNDCSECHSGVTGDFSTHTTQDHTTQVTLQTECNSCHTETVDYANFIDAADVKKHDACSTCHDGTTNAPVATAGDCSQCHTANYFDSHTHSHDVSYDLLTDTSQTTEQGCAVCHDDNGGGLASWTDISVEHLNNCATCHSYTDDGNGTPVQTTVATTIASGTSVTCATCHTPKVPDVDHGVDHIASSYVTGEAACLVCHIDPATTFTDPSNGKIHDNCATCHDVGTNALIGSATSAIPGGPNTCTTCHTGRDWTDHDIAHATNSYVTSYDGCTSCHAAALTDGAGFVDPANNGKHDACTTCHAADGAISVTVNDCSECHSGVTGDFSTHTTQDHTTQVTLQAECSSCHTETVDYANFIDAADVKKHDACSTCHDGTTNAPVALAGDCSQCHTANYFDSHTHSHDVSYDLLTDTSQTTEQGCAVCHDDNGGGLASWTDISVEHLNNCATCHSYTDDGNGTPVQTTVATTIASGTSVTCATCHTPKVPDVDHGVDHIASSYVTGEAACLVCHTDPATTFTDPSNGKIHDNCATCHDVGTNALIGSATSAIPGGPNTCTTCHTGRDWTDHDIAHATNSYVTSYDGCTSCHAAALTDGAGFVDPANNGKHDACTTCHAADGAISVTVNDCSECHSGVTGDFSTHTTQDHTTQVTLQAECSSCHTETVDYANFIDAADVKKHDACSTCHDGTTNAPVALAGDCSQCHTANYFDSHTHTHDVSYNPLTDTSQTTEQGCAVCHDDNGGGLASWTDISVEHLNNCATCHSYTDDGNGTPVQTTVATTIASGTSVTCATCHTPKVPDVDHGVDHIASSYVTGEAACLVCHTDPATTFTDPSNGKIHDNCATCHDVGTNALIGSATSAIPGGPNTCTTCHTGRDWTDHDIDHATDGYVTLHSECTSCHATTMTSGAGFVDPANNGKHDACTTCHAADGAISVTVNDCSECHSGETGDWTTHAQDHTVLVTQQAECSSCHSATVEYVNFVDPANVVKHDDCYVCHDNTTKLASATAGDCSQCHTANYFDSHTHTHDVSYNLLTDTSQTTEQGCAVCHDDNGGGLASWTDISVEHLNNCATCHSYTDDGNGTPVQTTVATTIASGTSVTCATCHTPKVPDVDHGVDHIGSAYVTGEAACLVCHTDPATTFTDPANAKIHDNCATCHDAGTNALIGSATSAIPGGPNTCTTCHTGRDWTDHDIDHATDGYVTLHSECTSCHATTMTSGAGFVDPANNGKHDACTTCHAADGAISVTVNDCSECHSGETGDWTTHAQDHTVLVTQQAECSSCHSATVEYVNFVDPANVVKHDDCYVCHDNTTKLASATAGDCSQCHTANYFDSHTHTHDVSYNPLTDTSQTTEQGCAVCHDDNGGGLASWTDISVEHLNNCATCHSYTDDGNGTPVQTTVATTIASGTSVTCATCHTPKVPDVDHGVDHIGSAYVTGEAACLVCHTDPATTFTDPANAKIHDNCATCHDAGTNALIGSATSAIPGGPNTCTTCHTGRDWTDHDIDHATDGYVTLHSECTSCHATTMTSGAGFVDPANNGKHDACTTCHAADGAISVTVNDCSECHSGETGDWTTHAQDHTVLVTQQAECSSCHSATVEYVNFVDPANVVKHDDCYVCHDNTTKLASATAGDCSQCHTANYFDSHTHTHDVSYNPLTDTSQTTEQGCAVCHDDNGGGLASWTDISVEHLNNCATCHSYTDDGNGTPVQTTVATTIASGTSVTCATCHTPKVPDVDHGVDHIGSAYVTGEAACLVCHTDPATTFTDPANAKIHDNCATCHDAGTNALIGSATSAIPGGPNTCTTCHTGRDWTDHDIDHATDGYVTLHSECTSCHATTMTSGAGFVDPANNGKHDACTTCHAADGAISVTVNDCSECHSGETGDWTTHAQDHTVLVTQQAECSSCHSATVEYVNFVDPANVVKHDDCYVCHDNTTKLASATAGDCSQCHTANYFDSHTHTHDVSYNLLTDTSQTTEQGCAVCHDDNGGGLASWTDISVEHLNNCATCHSYTDDGNGTPVQTTVATTIASGTSVTCATCHTPKVPDVDHGVDHIASSYVTGEAACLVCHTDPATTFTDPSNGKIHDNCATCHDVGTNALIGSATSAIPGGPNTCTTCHTGRDWTDHDIAHATNSYVTSYDGCTSCHAAALTDGAGFVDPANNGKHDACTTCHAADGAISVTVNDCSECHSGVTGDFSTHTTQDHTTQVTLQAECSSCHTETVDYANFIDAADVKKHDACSTCHDGTTNAPVALAGDCSQCHTANYFDSHTHSHDVSYDLLTDTSQTTEQGCAVCHDDNGGGLASWTDISVEHLNNCATCHSYTDDGNGTPVQTTVATTIASGTSVTCATCHTPKVPDVDHGVDHIASSYVTGEAACLVCHIDPATTFTDPANGKIHDNCATCHDVGTNALIGSATSAIPGGPNTCTTCHTGRDWTDHDIDHATDGYVTLHSECTSCHATTMTSGAGFVDPANNGKHDACTTCHAADGAISVTVNDCSECHSGETGDWTTHAQDHTVLVTQQAECSSCHSATVEYVNFVDPANVVKHDDCYVCHDNTTKLASATAGDCSQCHTANYFDSHTHTHDVSYNLLTDTSQTTEQGCAVCHDDNGGGLASWTDISVEHLNNCATCHSYTDDGNGTPVQTTVATTIASGTSVTCATCHTPKVPDVDHGVDHIASSYVTGEAACLVCHTDPATTFTDPSNGKIHDNCATCHDVGTNALIGSATSAIPGGPNTCTTCHTGRDWTDHDIAHATNSYVTSYDGCTSCHAAALTDGAGFVDPANNGKHDACTTCHAADGAISVTVNDCSECHSGVTGDFSTHTTQDHTTQVTLQAECSSCHTETVDYANFIDAADVKKHDACSTCHDGTTNAPVALAGDCSQCHTANYFDSHTHSHDVSYDLLTDTSQTTEQGCAVCHDDNGGGLASWTDISVEHLNNCATCHSYTDDGNGTPVQTTVATTIASGTSVTCATCHTPKVPDVDHGVDHIASSYVTGEAACLVCHIDPATTFTDPANGKIHDNCATCHDVGTNALIGSATSAIPGGPNTCTTCHTGRDWTDHDIDHATDGYVTLHSECTSCHATTMTSGAGFVDPANNGKHDACTTCHAADGAISVTVNDCSECHSGETGDWTTHAQDHTVLVTQQAECSSCHSATVEYVNFVDPANVVKHDDCYVCHDNTTKLASATAGDCSQCHTANYFDSHTHTHDVSYNPLTDTSQTTEQGCAVCHDDNGGGLASWTDISVEHLNNCATCHSYTDDGNGTPVQTTVATTIASGTSVTCATCHTPKVPDVDHGVDHIGSAYVTGEAACLVCHTDPATTFTDPANAKIHDNCATCHDAGTNALIGSATSAIPGGPNTCTTCHTGRDWTDHDIDHATDGYVTLHSECTSCHATTMTSGAGFVDPANNGKHDACTTCHAADGAISVTVNDCSECHSGETGDWTTHAEDHTLQVTQATGCASCHSATVDYAAFVDPANNVKHDDCYVCHDNTTKLASAAAGDCSQCHGGVTGDFATHTTQDHTLLVTQATGCSSCHSATVDYAAFVDPANNFKHDSCATCHNATTNAPVATAGDCSQCHSGVVGDFTTHTTQDHTTKVTQQSECSSCHTETVDYANFVDGTNDKKHDACVTCHNATTNAAAAPAGDCSQCHTANYFDSHTHSHTVSVGGDQSNGQSCDDCHDVTNWTLIEGTEHNVATNGAGSCATCHNSPTQTVIDVIAAGAATTCLDCHTDKTAAHGSIDHMDTGGGTGYVLVGGTQEYYGTTCASCHDPGGAENATVDVTHSGDCALCHTTVPALQPGVPAGGGDCVTCHTPSEHTLWGRYLDTCSQSGDGTYTCHPSFDGGPGNAFHDAHNPSGGWSDRDSATSGLIYPFASNPEMWQSNWPLNPTCDTCHTSYASPAAGVGCNACHNFKTNKKGPLHLRHSDGIGKGGLDIECSMCHYND